MGINLGINFTKRVKSNIISVKNIAKTNSIKTKPSKGYMTDVEFGSKIHHILSELNLEYPVSIFVATGGGIYRKPLTGVIDTFYRDISVPDSVMVGDAAGRYDKDTGFYTDRVVKLNSISL